MAKDKVKLSAEERKIIRDRGNPYWLLQCDAPVETMEPFIEERRVYLHKLENPHAFHAVMGDPEDHQGEGGRPRAAVSVPRRDASKSEFQRGCRRIFAQYIPAMERGRLREHHRDFILRNENAPSNRRSKLLASLARYDLSQVQGLNAQFNRERDVLTEAKLKAVEREADEGQEE
jgi:hypothetical protein